MAENNLHPNLPNSQLHKPLDFVSAVLSSEIEKTACGEYIWTTKIAQRPVVGIAKIDEAPPTTDSGDRYLLVEGDSTVPNILWGEDVAVNDLAEYPIDTDGTSWCETTPFAGIMTWVDSMDVVMVYDGTKWKANANTKLYSESSEVATTGASEETLASYTLDGLRLLNDEESVVIEATMVLAANANAKTIKLKFGTKTYSLTPANVNDRFLKVQMEVIRLSRNSQRLIVTQFDSQYDNSAAMSGKSLDLTHSADLNDDQDIVLTGQGVAASDITKKSFKVTHNP